MRINGFIPDTNMLKLNKPEVVNETASEATKFGNVFKGALDKVNDTQVVADDAVNTLIKGGDIEIHQVMLATEEAKMSLQMAVQVRNKLVEAVQELTRMQL